MALLSIKLEKSNFLLAWLTLLAIYCRDQTKPSGESATGGAATHLCLRTEIFRPTLAIHSHLLSLVRRTVSFETRLTLNLEHLFQSCLLDTDFRVFRRRRRKNFFTGTFPHQRVWSSDTDKYIHERCSSYLLMSKQSYISEKCQHWSWCQSQDDHSSETQVDEGLQEAPGDYYFQWSTFGCCEQNNNYQFKHNCC